MDRHLNLVESDFEQFEKRVLPRFPFCYLTFKCSHNDNRVFEVKDISSSGMQLALKDGDHQLQKAQSIGGLLHWGKKEIEVKGSIKWIKGMRLGIEFSSQESLRNLVDKFLDTKSMTVMLKPIHKVDYGVELPPKLKYWLRSDGPVEVFIWQHGAGDLSKFQIILMENFIEWEDGNGLKTGRVISKRDIDTPLINEDEFVFKIDKPLDTKKISLSKDLLEGVSEEQLPKDVIHFLKMKLGF